MRLYVVIVAAIAACGGTLHAVDGGDDAPTVDVTCPGAVPVAGAHCVYGLECEYGGVNGQCTTLAKCGGAVLDGIWTVTTPANGCGVNQASCPATFDALAASSACPLTEPGACTYPEGVCECTSCLIDAGASTQWTCRAFDTGSACASPRPLLGAPCAVEGAECVLGCCESIALGPDETCHDGHWQREACTAFCQAPPQCAHP